MAVVRFLRALLPLLALVLGAYVPARAQPGRALSAEWVMRLNPQEVGGSIRGLAITRDAAGNLYITGDFTNTVRLGELWLRAPQGSRAAVGFVAQLSPAGRWRWAQVLSSADSSASSGESITTDGAGGVYLTGSFQGHVRFAPHLSLRTPRRPDTAPQHFIARLDTAGRWQWAQPLAIMGAAPSQVASDAAGSAYVNGGPAPAADKGEAVAGKLNPQGRWLWTATAPAGTRPRVHALAVSQNGPIFLAGSLLPPSTQALEPAARGWGGWLTSSGRPFVARLSAVGKWEWTTTAQPEGDGQAACEALRVGPGGDLFVAGQYSSPLQFASVAGQPARLSIRRRSSNIFAASLTAAGQWRWATAPTTSGSSFASPGEGIYFGGLDLDDRGQLCLTGTYSGSAQFPTHPSRTYLKPGITEQPYLAWLSPTGRWLAAGTPTSTSDRTFPEAAYPRAVLATGVGRVVLLNHAPGALTDESSEMSATLALRLSEGNLRTPDRWPVLAQADGGGSSHVQALAPDGRGNVAVAGVYTGRLPGPGQPLLTGSTQDMFVGVLDAQGAWRWRQAGGFPDHVEVKSVAADSSGRVYVLGIYHGQGVFRLDSLRGQTTLANVPPDPSTMIEQDSWFIGQLGPGGGWRWARRLQSAGSFSREYDGVGLAVDPGGNAWVAWLAPDSLQRWNAPVLTLQHLTPEGQLRWSRPLARGSAYAQQLVYSPAGELYLRGSFRDSAAFPLRRGEARLRTRRAAATEGFVARLALDGTGEWALSTGPGMDVTALVPVPGGGVGVAGSVGDTVRLATYPQPTVIALPRDERTGFVARLDAAGTWRWAQRMGTSFPHTVALTADGMGRLHLAGQFQDSLTVATQPAPTRLRAPSRERVFVAHLGAAGQWLAVRDLKAGDQVSPLVMAVGPTGQLYLGGSLDNASGRIDSLRVDGPTATVARGLFREGYVAQLSLGRLSGPPQVHSASPRRAAPGAWIVVQGTGLASVSQVRVGGITAPVEVVSDQQLRVQVPAGTKRGKVPLDMVSPRGHTQLPQRFRIIHP